MWCNCHKSRKEMGLWSYIIWLTREHKKEAPDWICSYMISSKIRRFPYVLPAGCPSCLTTLKGVWVKNTTDCLDWERRLLERDFFKFHGYPGIERSLLSKPHVVSLVITIPLHSYTQVGIPPNIYRNPLLSQFSGKTFGLRNYHWPQWEVRLKR